MKAGRHWYSKSCWSDWLTDPVVRTSTLAAQGLWMNMLAHMHASSEAGYLVISERAATAKDIARMIGQEP